MRIVFADTFYWIALLNTNGQDHKQVIQFGKTNPNINLVTTEPVVDEPLILIALDIARILSRKREV